MVCYNVSYLYVLHLTSSGVFLVCFKYMASGSSRYTICYFNDVHSRSQYLAEKKAKFITQEISDMDFLAVISTVLGTDGYVDMQDIFPYTMLGEVVCS